MNNNNKNLKLIFRYGEESHPVVESSENLETSIFKASVDNAIQCIESIVSHNVNLHKEHNVINNDIRNNIVAFLGDRGTGKTSCMRTVVEILKGKYHAEKNKTQNRKWYFLNEIDPSFLDENHNILEIFIGNIYGEYKKLCDDWECKSVVEQSRLREINHKFVKVKSALSYLNDKQFLDHDHATDELRHLNDGSQLQGLMSDLISSFLKINGEEVLIISIDDLDVNIEQSYKMIEYLRMYLMNQQVVILTAAKYTQIIDSICINLKSIYKDISHRVSDSDMESIANKYLQKVIPLAHRFEMPIADSFLDMTLEIFDKTGQPIYQNDKLSASDILLRLIFEKTRYLFFNHASIPSLIIPRNLRELRMMIGMLINMNDFDDEVNVKLNQQTFRSYFYTHWLENLSINHRQFAIELLGEENVARINHMVITRLNDYFIKGIFDFKSEMSNHFDSKSELEYKLLNDILKPINSYWNISIGDVIFVMRMIRRWHKSVDSDTLLFFITTFYSFKLYELYNSMTDSIDEDGILLDIGNKNAYFELKGEDYTNIPPFFRFVGGAFFSITGDSFIPMSNSDSETRERRIINGEALKHEIAQIIEEYNNFDKQNKDKNAEYPVSLTYRLCLIEFFILCCKERVNLKSSSENLRQNSEAIYFKKFGGTAKNIIFDISAPFFNAIYPEFSYQRFNKDLFGIVQRDKHSLYNQLVEYKKRNKPNNPWEVMSKMTIRNMEVLEGLTEWFYSNRDSLRPEKRGDRGIITDFYYKLANPNSQANKGYTIPLYMDHHSGQDASSSEIDFSIYSIFANILRNVDILKQPNDPDLQGIFNSIYNNRLIFSYQESYEVKQVYEVLCKYCEKDAVNSVMNIAHDESLDTNQLLKILSDLRVSNGFDFSERLSFDLTDKYLDLVKVKFADMISFYETELINAEVDLENDITGIRELNAQLTELRSEIKQLRKDIQKAEVQNSKLLAQLEINTQQDSLISKELEKLESLQLEDKADSKQIATLNKELQKLRKNKLAIQTEVVANNNMTNLSRSLISEKEAKIVSLKQVLTDSGKASNQHRLKVNRQKVLLEAITKRQKEPIQLKEI